MLECPFVLVVMYMFASVSTSIVSNLDETLADFL